MREQGRLPIRRIQWYLSAACGLDLSIGEMTGVLCRVADMVRPVTEEIRQRVRSSPVVFADETGWREDGENGFVWTFSTSTGRHLVRRRRNKEVAGEVLGYEPVGVLVTDFYAAYNHYPGLKQRCWAHLLGDIHDLTVVNPEEKALETWAAGVKALYTEANEFSHADARRRNAAKRRFERRLLALCRPHVKDESAPQHGLANRMERFIKELFVAEPEVPSDNNRAERSLRPLVIARKISGGTRSERGTETKMILASVFGTWTAQGINPLAACRQLLAGRAAQPKPGGAGVPRPPPPPPRGLPIVSRPQLCAQPA